MATLTVKNSTYSSTSTSITITFTTDITPTAVKLTKDGTNWITATTFTSNSATFNVSSWPKGTYTNCQLKVSYVEESSGSELTITNINAGTFTTSDIATISYTTNSSVTKHEFRMNKAYAYSDGSDRVTSNGNNHTLKFNAGDLSAGAKNGSIRVTDASGNTAESDFTLTITEAAPTSYTITKNLSNCSCSNNTSSVTSGSSYVAIITANSGYNLSSLTVTMRGSDITASVVSESTISISNVTGNIVITARATQQQTPSTPSTPSTGAALDDWDAFHNTYGNYVAYMADRVGVKGKAIRMTATQTTTTVQGSVTKNYRSGAMISKKAYKYGTFTFKFKLSANNTLLWPMIWTLPDLTVAQDKLIGKNQRPEYDLLESWGSLTSNNIIQTYHCTTPSGVSQMNYAQARTAVDLTKEHELKLVWTQDNVVKMYCDGVLKLTIKDYVTNWQTGEVDYQVWFLNLGLGGYDGTAPNGTGWFEITDYKFEPVYSRNRVKQDYGFGRFSNGTLPSGPLPSSSGGSIGGSSGGSSGGGTPGSSLTISNITGGTFTTSDTVRITYTTSAAVTKHEFTMDYVNNAFTDGTARVTSRGNNHTMTFNAGILSAGTKNGAIRVTDASGNTAVAQYTLVITKGGSTPTPTPTPTPNPNPSTLSITNINGGTFTTSNSPTVTYTTSAAVVKHEYRINKEYSYTNAEGKVTSSGNNHTIRFNAGELSTGTKNGSIRVTDANGNTAEADFTLTINKGTSTTNYSITKNLTNCTCSNSASSISKGSSYSATITANNECALSTLTVTMGGTDITSSAVSGKTITGGTISISNVTGNIVITASAEAIPGGGAPESTTLKIMNIKVLSSTEASTQINYTTNRAVTTHYFNMWYSGTDSGFVEAGNKVTDNGKNNYTMTFTNQLSAGTKTPAIKVQDSKGNTAIKAFDLTVTS